MKNRWNCGEMRPLDRSPPRAPASLRRLRRTSGPSNRQSLRPSKSPKWRPPGANEGAESPAPALPVALKPEAQAEKRAGGGRQAATAGQESNTVVSRVDSIESVRILRSDGPPSTDQAAPAPSTGTAARTSKVQEATPKQATAEEHSQDHGAGPATSTSRTAPSEPDASSGARQRHRDQPGTRCAGAFRQDPG